MKKILILGAGGFIGGHLAEYFKTQDKDNIVIGVDSKTPEFRDGTFFNEFMREDLRDDEIVLKIFNEIGADEIYQLAADMGGMGFIGNNALSCLINNQKINNNIAQACYTTWRRPKSLFFSSSVCVYRDMKIGESVITEDDAYPAMPDNEYGWEKLYSERMYQQLGKDTDIRVSIARFQNCFGEMGTWIGGREKAPAAMCRKVALGGQTIKIWGDGTAVRNYIYVRDLVRAIDMLVKSRVDVPVNIGTDEYISVNELVDIISDIAKIRQEKKYIPGIVGVQSRNFSNERIKAIGWRPEYTIRDGLEKTYPWIKERVDEYQKSQNKILYE